MGTQGALVHTTQGGIRYAAYYDQGGPFEDFTGGEATAIAVRIERPAAARAASAPVHTPCRAVEGLT